MNPVWLHCALCVALAAVPGGPSGDRVRQADPPVVGARLIHVVQPGESLSAIGARFGVEPRVLARLNGLEPQARLRSGERLLVDSRHIAPDRADVEIVINIPQRMLFHLKLGRVVGGFPVGLGRPSWPTFTGSFAIALLETNPTWDVPRSIQEEMRRSGKPVLEHVPPGPGNPLGEFWIGLDRAGYGIHATNAPASIYRFQTHGCIRLHPDDARQLFEHVTIGTRGEIIYEPVLLVELEDSVLLEVHADIYGRVRDLLAAVRERARRAGIDHVIDWEAAREVVRAKDGTPVDVSLRHRSARAP